MSGGSRKYVQCVTFPGCRRSFDFFLVPFAAGWVTGKASGLCTPASYFQRVSFSFGSILILQYVQQNNTCLPAICPGLPGWAGSRKVKPVWIVLKQETVGGSGISWAICKSAPRQYPTSQIFFTGRLPFLPPKQQCQSTEVQQKCPIKRKQLCVLYLFMLVSFCRCSILDIVTYS